MFVVAICSQGAFSAKFQRPNLGNLLLPAWDGVSPLSLSKSKCRGYFDGTNAAPLPFDFNLTMTQPAPPSGYAATAFWLVNTVDSTQALRVTLSLSRTGASYDAFAPGETKTGLEGTDCNITSVPIYHKAEISTADAYRVPAGTYETIFDLEACEEKSITENYQGKCKADKNGVKVRVIIPPLIQISDLSDLDFGTYGAAGAALTAVGDEICVYSNTGAYQLTVSGTAGTSPYAVTDFVFGGDVLPYTISVGDVAGSANRGAVQNGVAETAMSTGQTAGAYDVNCAAKNAYIEAAVLQSDLDATPAGSYLDTITVTATMP